MLELGAIIFSQLGKLPVQRSGSPSAEHHLAKSRLYSPKAADLGDLAAEDANGQPGSGKGVIEALSQSVSQVVGSSSGGQPDMYGTAGGSKDGQTSSNPDSGDLAPDPEGAGTKAAGACAS